MQVDDRVREVAPALLGLARALTADRGLAEDLAHDVLVKLLTRDLDTVADLPAYARRMVLNEYLSFRRRWSRVVPVQAVPDRAEPDSSAAVADRALLRAGLIALPRRQRAVLVLRYFTGLTDDEIATELGCSVSTVRSHASRGLAALRVELTEPLPERTRQ